MEPMTQYFAKTVSSLVKVFPDEEPKKEPECTFLTALKNETVSFQAAYSCESVNNCFAKVGILSPLAEKIHVRNVVNVPCSYPAHAVFDDNYLRTASGMYPDLLSDLEDGQVTFTAKQWKSIWIDINVTEDTLPGKYPVKIDFSDPVSGESLCCCETAITIYDAVLPKQTLRHTEWFHGDCLADYYHTEVFSERHWEIIDNFIKTAVKRGINMILTPQFTPPLDTAKGGERTTIQLVDITVDNGVYSFDFGNLRRWVILCQNAGVQYFEMSHLFTQWGAAAAPKIMATVNGAYKQIFGWDTPAVGGAYTEFLHIYLPQLTAKLKEWGIADNTYFHISDEPTLQQFDSYCAAKDSVAAYLDGFTFMDALSSYEFYRTGAVAKPVSATNHIQAFLEHGVKNMWSYYCTSQYINVSNRFMSMPSSRNRIYGIQLFKYDIEGILHWGFNFYNTQYSLHAINPYQITDSGCAFPSGDAFLVYPKADGTPEESIRIMVQYEAMTDLRALQYLAELTSKEYVLNLIEGDLAEPVTFETYPKSDYYLIRLRNTINREIMEHTATALQ